MDFTVTILGSGAALPTAGRHCSSQIVNINGFRMLVDCGESTQNQMRVYHQRIQSFGHIFISHLHGDHIFGLPGLLASMSMLGRVDPVVIFAPAGLKEALDKMLQVSDTHLNYELQVVDLTADNPQLIYENEKCRVTTFPLEHSVPCYGFIFEECIHYLNLRREVCMQLNLTPDEIVRIKEGQDYVQADGTVIANSELTLPRRQPRRYAYCCDTAYTEYILPMIQGVDLLCIESTFDNSRLELALEKKHCTAAQAGLMARQAAVQQLLLTHFSARYKSLDPLLYEAQQEFANTIVAEDGEVIELRSNRREV